MGEDDKRKFQAGATMQIELDQVQLVDLEAAVARRTPPPLPDLPPGATASSAPPRPLVTEAPPASAGKNLVYLGLIAIVVALAVAAGLMVGRRVSASAPAASSAAVLPSAAPPSGVLTIPPIEVK